MLQYASRALAQRLLICLLLLPAPKTGNTQIAPPMPRNAASSQTTTVASSQPLYASLLPGSLQGFLDAADPSSPEYVLFSGLWRTDGGFHSTVRMKNVLAVAPLHVTPVLYMADGTEYSLPAVNIPISGVATVDVNATLADVPPNIAPHISQHGSVALKYRYSSTGHLAAYVAIIDPLRSLSFTFPFVEPGAMQMVMASHSDQHVHSTPQTMEGLWWKHDGGVMGFVTLTNTTGAEQKAAVRISGSLGHAGPTQSVTLCAHCTQVLDLTKAVKDLPNNEQQAGGVSVQYAQMADVLVGGGLLNEGEGYSANIPFWPHDTTSSPIAMTYASAGIMTGKPDPMNGFPAETVFMPYLSLRNTSTKPLDVILRVNYMKGSAPATVNLPPQRLRPMEARQIDMSLALAGLALADFNGVINLAVSLTGQPGDLVLASGSVDQTGTYVFEVEPQGTGTSQMKFANYWSVAGGNDTMYSLWNPTDTAQDLKLTFYYGDGSGKYVLPMHLAGQASAMVDMKEVIMQQRPDSAGNIIPFAIQEGSVTIANAKGDHEQMTIVISGGVYNAADATCGPPGCINCCGYSNFANTPGNGFSCAVGETMDFTTTGTDCSGSTTVFGADWSSDNTSYATMNVSTMSGLSPGAVNIGNYLGNVVVYSGQFCAGYDCPSSAPTITSSGNIKPTISGPTTVWWFGGISSSGSYPTSISLTSNGGGGTVWSVVAGGSEVSINPTGSTVTVSASGSAFSSSSGDVQITAQANGQTSDAFHLTTRRPYRLVSLGNTRACDSTYGYAMQINYKIQDQLLTDMTADIAVNEKFTTLPIPDYSNTNWRRGPEVNGTAIGGQFFDSIQGEAFSLPANPTPSCTGSPATKVQHWGQEFRIGSLSTGSGQRVQTDTLQKYVNWADHEGITSPSD